MTGHDERFNKMFYFLLKFCIKNGYYEYYDFLNNNVEYCGIDIKNNFIE